MVEEVRGLQKDSRDVVGFEYNCVCMGSLYRCIVACAHLVNGTGCRTVIMVAPLLLISGLDKHEAVLHSCGTKSVAGGVGTGLSQCTLMLTS